MVTHEMANSCPEVAPLGRSPPVVATHVLPESVSINGWGVPEAE